MGYSSTTCVATTGEECVECKTTVHHWYIAAVVLSVAVAAGLLVHLCFRRRQWGQGKRGFGDQAMHQTGNPLQPYEQRARSSRSTRGSLSERATERRDNAYLAVRALYQPVRILVGYIQVSGTGSSRLKHRRY
jgi:hypothetical protein